MTDRALFGLIKKHYRVILVFTATFLIGIAAHILGVTNDIFNHDSMVLEAGQNYWLRFHGKWAAGYIYDALTGFLNSGSWFVPMGIMFLAASAALIFSLLRIRRVLSGILIGATLVTFYTVASMIIYYGPDFFCCCFFMAVLGAYCVSRCTLPAGLLGMALFCLSMGGYQPYIAAAASVLVLDCISRALFTDEDTKHIFIRGVWYVVSLLVGVLCYYGILQYFKHTGYINLIDYQEIRALASGEIPIGAFLYSLDDAWKATHHFLFGRADLPYDAMPILYAASAAITVVTFALTLFRREQIRKPVRAVLTALLVFVAFPITVNLVVALTVQGSVHDIMGYAVVLVFVLPIVLSDGLAGNDAAPVQCASGSKNLWFGAVRAVDAASLFVSVMLIVMWSCLDNDLYRMMILADHQLQVDATSVISAVYANDDYSEETEVVLLGKPPYRVLEDQYSLLEKPRITRLHNCVVGVLPSSGFMFTSDHMKRYMNERLGADFVFADEEAFYAEHQEACDSMQVFPGGKAVRSIDGTLVVKLSEMKTE